MFQRLLFAAALLARVAFAQPALTTIQDTLFMANGTRFNGTLTIAWTSFVAGDNSNIIAQAANVTVVDGNLRVQLVPSTNANPAGYYAVTYASNGQVQFQELWAVPPSSIPLYVRQVRIGIANGSSTGGSGSGGAGADTGAIAESGVTGLVADLAARPVKGPAFAPGAVAVVDASGFLDSVSGASTDCVHVDGSTGPCGGSAPAFVDGDTITGIVDGANTTFSLSAVPNPAASLVFYRNGMLQKAGLDFTLTNSSIQFFTASTPQPGDTLLASYRLTGSSSGSAQSFPNPQVLCSGTGNTVTAQSLTTMGSCQIPAGLLMPGDRVEVRFDTTHTGTANGFTVALDWGATTVLQRNAGANDTMVTAHADASIVSAGAQLGFTSWGAVLPFAAGVITSTAAYGSGLTINFQGEVTAPADSVTLANYVVVRIP
jgi:hypothetical protein